MRRISGMRWRLVAWVTGVAVAVGAVVFVVVYENTGAQLRSEIDHDVVGDVSQLEGAMRTVNSGDASTVVAAARRYMQAQPFTGTSSLLFVAVPGHATVSNHPEVFGSDRPDAGETLAEQEHENGLGRALLTGSTGLHTYEVPDVGRVRVAQRTLRMGSLTLRIGAGEPLALVARAQRSVAKSFAIAGAIALALALLASYLAAASVSLPLRRMAKVAARVDEGDLHPRMHVSAAAGSEVRILADAFNHMLDRLADAFATQRAFIADASHELRTPLTVIAGQIEVLAAEENPSADEIRRVQRQITAEVARTSRLVDDMLLLARAERTDFLQMREIDLAPFVHELWSSITTTATRRFELDPVPEMILRGDPDRLTQALRNLIRNAIEHTKEPDGLVRLEVEPQAGEWIRFTVLDDGPGVDPEQRERVFERFHRTDESRARVSGGTGLGLPIVRAIADAHGGTAAVLANDGGGAAVRLEIPGLRRNPGSTTETHGWPARAAL
jgi:two-component system, OmpR family, sensor kinase